MARTNSSREAMKAWGTSRLKNAVARDLQKAIRLEACDELGFCVCVTCEARKPWNQMEGGHFVGGRTNAVLFDERNVHPQCNSCNQHKGGNKEAYSAFILRTYGPDALAELLTLRFKTLKIPRDTLMDMREAYRARWKAALKGLPT